MVLIVEIEKNRRKAVNIHKGYSVIPPGWDGYMCVYEDSGTIFYETYINGKFSSLKTLIYAYK